MRPLSRFDYALKGLVDLALHQPMGPVTVKSIARRQQIPAQCLEQVFNRLRRHGLVAAERGPRGGYRLGRPAGEIPVSAVFESLEPKRPSSDHRAAGAGPDPTAAVWRQVETAVHTTLQATTLETLVAQAREKIPTDVTHPFTFHI